MKDLQKNSIKFCLTLTLICLFCLCTCNKRQLTPDELLVFRAEQIVDQHPDSALLLIRSVENPGELGKEHYANYLLLLTQTHDKNGINLTNDTLIHIAVEYFSARKDIKRMARAYYFQGRVNLAQKNDNVGQKNDQDVLINMLKAKEYARQSGEANLLGVIHYNIGCTYQGNGNFEHAYENFKLAHAHFVKAGNTGNAIRMLDYFGNMENQAGKTDTALYYYHQVLDYAEENQYTALSARMLHKIGDLYREKEEYIKAKDCVIKSIAKDSAMTYIVNNYTNMAACYLIEKKADSALIYVEKLPDTRYWISEETQMMYHHYRSEIHKEKQDYKSATKELEQIPKLITSRFRSSIKNSLPEMQEQFEKLTIENEYNQILVHRLRLIIAIILILLIGVIIGWFLMYRIKRKENELLEAKQALNIFQEMLNQRDSLLKKTKQSITESEAQLHTYNQLLAEQTEQLQNYNQILSERDVKSEQLREVLMDKLGIARKVAQINVVATENTKEFMEQFQKIFGENLLDWESIYPIINNLYDGFVDKIKEMYPKLLVKDIQLCCFIRAGFKTEEIAVLLNYTQSTVRVKKTRLSRKMSFNEFSLFLEHINSL